MLPNTTSVHLSWVAPLADQVNGILIGYQLQCIGQNGHTLSASVTGSSTSLYAIHINTHYTCTVCGYTSVGCGPNAITHISTYENCKCVC